MEWVVIAIVVLGFVTVIILLNAKLSKLSEPKASPELMEIIKVLQTGSKDDRTLLLKTLQQNTESLNQRLDNAAKVISDVQKNIGEMSEIGRGMRQLQEFLQSPKLRGNMGEQIMKELLGQMLPKNSFHLQYTFKSGEKVDAAIKTSAGIISIDSKFPMENFRKFITAESDADKTLALKTFERDVKGHIDAISKKYIVTEEGTIDYALMYVPSESVYYEIVNDVTLFEYATDKRVLPVSPTTFYAYLRVILMSFEGQKIEAETAKLFSSIRAIQKDYEKTAESMSVFQKHLTNAGNMWNNVTSNFGQLGQKITSIHQLEKQEEVKVLK
jgi:DNA recombination protein RmuC